MATNVTFTIPNEYVAEFISMVSARHPVPVDPATQEPLFTPAQWAKEYFRRLMIREFRAWKNDMREAIPENDSWVS